MNELSDYERRALEACVAYREERLAEAPRHLVPGRVQDAAARAAGKAKKLPGADKAGKAVAAAYTRAAGGVVKGMHRLTDVTLSEKRVVGSYHKHDPSVRELQDVHGLDLAVLDRVAHFKRLRNAYAYAAAGEGAAAGFVVTGGQAAAATGSVAGAGAGAAPGLGLVAATTGADTAVVLTLASHVVAQTSMYYGYDPSSPEEELFQMQVVGLGMATTQSAKAAAFRDLSKLTQLLARSAPWEQLSTRIFARIATRFATDVGQNLTKKKLGQLVPVAGIALGAGLNFQLMDEVGESAYWAYRERFLRDKAGRTDADLPPAADVVEEGDVVDAEVVDDTTDEPILVLEMLEEATREEAAPSGADAHDSERPPG